MFSSSIWMLLLTAVARSAFAQDQVCDMPEGWERFGFTAYNQTELDIIAGSCTIFNGNLYVHESYTGGFYLPNIRHIVGNLGLASGYSPGDGTPRPNLTSVELPDLESVKGNIAFFGMPNLKTISMPKLHSVNRKVSVDAAEEVDLRSLEAASQINIGGTLSTLRFNALEKADTHLVISKECGDVPPTPPLDISLPSLTTAGGIELNGRFSRVAMPQLHNISQGYSLYHSFQIDACGGPPFEVYLPKLDQVSMEVDIRGGIQDLFIPNLKKMTAQFRLNTTEQLDLTLPFEEAQHIHLSGNLTSVKFPNLDHAGYLNVAASVPFDCGALKKSVAPAISGKAEWYNKCTAPAGLGLSLGAKIGIGVGVGVGGLVVIAAGLWFFRRRRKQTKRLKSESNAHLRDMPPTYAETRNQGHPPDYASTDAR